MDSLALPVLASLALLQAYPSLDQLVHHANRSCDSATLTFDLCPVKGPGFDAELVEYLKKNKVPATFFASGQWMRTHDAQVRDLLATPHFELGTHGERHLHISQLDGEKKRAEFEGPIRLLKDKYGYTSKLYRPPFGEYDPGSLELAKELGQTVVLWDVVSADPDEKKSAQTIIERVRSELKGGSIPIFHANGKGKHTREVIETIYPEFTAKGLKFKTLGNLLESCPVQPTRAVAKAPEAAPVRKASAPFWPVAGALSLAGALLALFFTGERTSAPAPTSPKTARAVKRPTRKRPVRPATMTAKRRPTKAASRKSGIS